MEKLLQLVNDLDNIEDFIKINAFDRTKGELNAQDCKELLRLIFRSKREGFKMKILNLYACLGGNRAGWGNEHEITAVELDPELARMYKERFPNDTVIVGDAHQYLIEHYKNFDFIWSSPMCPTHGKPRFWRSKGGVYAPVYPDMALYQEIIFLDNFFEGKYCVENVEPYYTELIPAQKRGRHFYWCNFKLPAILTERVEPIAGNNELVNLCEFHKIDLSSYNGDQRKDKIARNLVDFEAGKTILDTALGIFREENLVQYRMDLFQNVLHKNCKHEAVVTNNGESHCRTCKRAVGFF